MRIRKHLVFTTLSVLVLLLIFLLLPPKKPIEYEQILIRNSIVQCICCPQPAEDKIFRQNLLFLKTHKSGSSTIQNIIFRFGLRHNLSFALPKNDYEITYYQKFSSKWLPERDQTPDGKYNLVTNHMRYDPAILEVMYPDTKSVTIMRDPAALFESLYTYFKLSTSNAGLTFKQWLKLPFKPPFLISPYPTQYLGYNQMSMDLGLDVHYFRNETVIHDFIEHIDREFDLVMITEHMDASLVLLANLMGWPLEYVRYLRNNSRPSNKRHNFTDEERDVLMEVNYADTLLYRYFLEKFHSCVVQYGIDRMNADITRLRQINMEFQRKCNATEVIHPYGMVLYNNSNESDFDCKYSAIEQVTLTKLVKNIQEERYNNRVS